MVIPRVRLACVVVLQPAPVAAAAAPAEYTNKYYLSLNCSLCMRHIHMDEVKDDETTIEHDGLT